MRASTCIIGCLIGSVASLLLPRSLFAQEASGALHPGQLVREMTAAHDSSTDDRAVRTLTGRAGGDARMVALLHATRDRLAFRHDDARRRYTALATDTVGLIGAYAQLGLATVAANQGDIRQTMRSLETAYARFRELGDRRGEIEARIGLVITTLRTVSVDSARAVLRTTQDMLLSDDIAQHARLGCVTMQVSLRTGTRVADSTWNRVIDGARPHGPRLLSECLFLRGLYLESIGRAADAVDVLDTVAVLQRNARLWSNLSATRQWQGSAHIARNNHARAREALIEAFASAQRSGSRHGEAWAEHELGRVAQRLGAVNDASSHFERARTLFQQTGDRTGLAMADFAIAEGVSLQGDLKPADSLWRVAMASSREVLPQNLAPSLVARADIARQQQNLRHAGMLLDSAAVLVQRRNQPGWANAIRYQRGVLALARDRPRDAIAQWDTLLRQQNLRGPSRFEVMTRWAEAFAADGQLDSAWRTFNMASRHLDDWLRGFARREDVLAILQDRRLDLDRDLGMATMVAQFTAANRVAEALAIAEWRRIRGKEQQSLQQGALTLDATRSISVTSTAIDTTMLDAQRYRALARARLPATHAVVAFMTGRGVETTTAFILTRDSLHAVPIAPIDSLIDGIERLAAFLQAGQLPAQLARDLSVRIITPVLATLPAAVDRIILVPDGELHRLPFAALLLPDGQSLLSRYTIAVAPSVHDALGSSSSVARSVSGTRTRAFVVGPPARMPIMPGSDVVWRPLPGARTEARRIASMITGGELLDGARATAEQFTNGLARGGNLLHIATHSVADAGSFAHNGIALQPTLSHHGVLDLAALRAQPVPFDLVVLSACSSGSGMLFAGQALHGLASTVLDAGARGVVATRWRIDDRGIVPYMEQLYTALAAGDDVVTALHRVRYDAMRNGESPAIWANLEYYGDPMLRVTLSARTPSRWSRMTSTVRGWLGLNSGT